MRYALIINNIFIGNREYPTQPVDIPHKQVRWLPCPYVTQPVIDPKTQAITGPTYAIQASQVLEQWGTRSLTAQEIADAKDASINAPSGDAYQTFLKTITAVLNEGRTLDRVKINDVITATGAITVPKFTAGQTAALDATQVRNYIRNNL